MTEEPKDGEMTHMEFLRAQFFSSDADHAAFAEKQARRRAATARRRIARIKDRGIRSLAYFVHEMRDADASEIRAALGWLNSRYTLGHRS